LLRWVSGNRVGSCESLMEVDTEEASDVKAEPY
jgi:hypothetical protein